MAQDRDPVLGHFYWGGGNMENHKSCERCGIALAAPKRGRPPKYCGAKCKEAQRYEQNKEKRLEANKKYCRRYYERNRSKVRDRYKLWLAVHPEASARYQKTYLTTHRDEVLARKRAIARRDKDKRQEYKRTYRLNHPEKEREYKAKNLERFRTNYRRYRGIRRTRKTAAGGSFTKEEWIALLNATGHKCLHCGATGVKLTVDHVIPVVRGGTSNIENIQPLCTSCNSKKRDKVIDYRGHRG